MEDRCRRADVFGAVPEHIEVRQDSPEVGAVTEDDTVERWWALALDEHERRIPPDFDCAAWGLLPDDEAYRSDAAWDFLGVTCFLATMVVLAFFAYLLVTAALGALFG